MRSLSMTKYFAFFSVSPVPLEKEKKLKARLMSIELSFMIFLLYDEVLRQSSPSLLVISVVQNTGTLLKEHIFTNTFIKSRVPEFCPK